MSFHQDPKTDQVVIHCDVCEEPILNSADGHVEWNADGPFTFIHYECSDPDAFNGHHYTYNANIARWVESLVMTYPVVERNLQGNDEEPAKPLYPHRENQHAHSEWKVMRADEFLKMDFKKGGKK